MGVKVATDRALPMGWQAAKDAYRQAIAQSRPGVLPQPLQGGLDAALAWLGTLGEDQGLSALANPMALGNVTISAFDGIGGMAQAAKEAGVPITSIHGIEILPSSRAIAARSHPEKYVQQYGDIWGVNPADLPKNPDLFCAGFPCKDLSKAKALGGNRQIPGLTGERSKLFYPMLDLMERTNPRNFVIENTGQMEGRWRDIISKELGVEPVLIDSADFGPAHRRRYYWTNKPLVVPPASERPGAAQTMADVVDWPRDPRTMHTPAGEKTATSLYGNQQRYRKLGLADYDPAEKLRTVTGNWKKGSPTNAIKMPDGRIYALTPEEAEKAQGLPVGYTAGYPKTTRYEAVGEGFNMPTMAEILRQVLGSDTAQAIKSGLMNAMGQGRLW